MNWNDVSDFEINKKVAHMHLDLSKIKDSEICEKQPIDGGSYVMFGHDIYWSSVDYCNSPADMWPIIASNAISIIKAEKTDDEWVGFLFWNDTEFCHKNPLRAAAIVYLMMNGVKAEDCK